MRLAILHKEKCKPTACGQVCKKYCPVERKEADSCIIIKAKAVIDEETCIGCGICQKRCPFDAIEIVNLPSVDEKDNVYRYGKNGFSLYNLPIPRKGKVVGMLGRNGIGKSTAVEILAGKKKINLGKESVEEKEVKDFLQGTELMRYFDSLKGKKIAYKPQNLSAIAINVKVMDMLKQRASEKMIKKIAKELDVEHILESKLNRLSGGELQKIAIIAASLGESDIYFFDEPLAYLDIAERLKVSDFIKEIAKNKTVVVVEHDLLILDYLTEHLNIFFGKQGCFGLVSGLKSSKDGVNAYLKGFLREENLRIRDKELNFNFTKNKSMAGKKIAEWPDFKLRFDEGFSLKVKKGEIKENHVVGVLGKNGTGKTSFVKALVGELDAESGKLDLGLEISYKPQYLFTDLDEKVRDIIEIEKIPKKLASTFNLGVISQKKLEELSGGELQRFSIARCLAKNADVYFIDEPSAYLDVEERVNVAKAIKEIMVEKQKTAYVVDHDLLLVSYLADSVIVFSGEGGRRGESSEVMEFEEGISNLLKQLDVTLRKDKDSGRPRINKKGSVLDREQKHKGKYAIF